MSTTTPVTATSIRELLLGEKAKKLLIEPVQVGDLGTIHVKGLTSAQRTVFESSLTKGGKRDTKNAYARLAVRCICTEDGTRVFGDEDALELGTIRADYLQIIYDVAQRLSGYSKEDLDELGKASESGGDTPD